MNIINHDKSIELTIHPKIEQVVKNSSKVIYNTFPKAYVIQFPKLSQ